MGSYNYSPFPLFYNILLNMSIQYLEYKGLMVPVSQYMRLKAQEAKGVDPLLSEVTETEEAKEEKPVEVKNEGGKEEIITKRKPGLPTKDDIRKALDERGISYTQENCWATLYKKFVQSS